MTSPHLLRPFSARQLSLVAGDGRVVVFGVLGGRYAGPTALVHVPTLRQRLAALSDEIDVLAFIDRSLPDAGTIATVDDMVDSFLASHVDALAKTVPANEAVKRVVNGRVQEGVDRSRLVTVGSPEVVRRRALVRAIEATDVEWLSPTRAVADTGGVVRFVEFGNAESRQPNAVGRKLDI